MKNRRLLNLLGEMDERYIEEAAHKALMIFIYLFIWGIFSVNLTAPWLYLSEEMELINLPVLGEWIQGWLVLYSWIWIIPLIYLIVINKLTQRSALVSSKTLTLLLIIPLSITIIRYIQYKLGYPWLTIEMSLVYAIMMSVIYLHFSFSLFGRILRKIKRGRMII